MNKIKIIDTKIDLCCWTPFRTQTIHATPHSVIVLNKSDCCACCIQEDIIFKYSALESLKQGNMMGLLSLCYIPNYICCSPFEVLWLQTVSGDKYPLISVTKDDKTRLLNLLKLKEGSPVSSEEFSRDL